MSASKQESPWYVEAFGALYLKVYAHRDEGDARRAVACIERELQPQATTRLLDLCCGAGRHLKLLERSCPNAIGLDLSEHLLVEARKCGVSAPLLRGNILELPFEGSSFDMVVNLFTSFGYFESDAENAAVAKGIARALAPRAVALFDIINPAYTLARLVPESVERRNGMELSFQRHYDTDTRRVVKDVEIAFEDGSPNVAYRESVRLYQADEFDELLSAAGMRVTKRLGNFDSSSFEENSPRQIVIASRE